MRRLAPVTLMVVVWMGAALPAVAGGAVWEFEQYQRPGEEVVATTAVAWDHSSLETPEQGPYFVYLTPMEVEVAWPDLPAEAILVGLVEVHEGPYQDRAGDSMGPNHAIARFEIPDIDPGSYQILQCNDPCTSTFGDIAGGWDLRVVPGSEGRPADVIAAEVIEASKGLPLLFQQDPPTTVFAEIAAEPVTQTAMGLEPDRVRIEVIDAPGNSSPGETGTASVVDEGDSLADMLTVGLVVSVISMVWVGWSRGPEKKR